MIAELIAAGIPPTQARIFAEPIARAFERFAIDSRPRRAAFVAQAAHESANFTRLEESLFYRTPERIRAMWPNRVPSLAEAAKLCRNPRALANRVYANRLGNGDEASGEGWKYRGRGLFQLTGRANYMAAGDALGQPYKAQPEMVAQPEHAALTAGWYWSASGLNELADGAQIDAITRRINGPAMVAADERRSLFDEALRAFA
jgi:putative chitinase